MTERLFEIIHLHHSAQDNTSLYRTQSRRNGLFEERFRKWSLHVRLMSKPLVEPSYAGTEDKSGSCTQQRHQHHNTTYNIVKVTLTPTTTQTGIVTLIPCHMMILMNNIHCMSRHNNNSWLQPHEVVEKYTITNQLTMKICKQLPRRFYGPVKGSYDLVNFDSCTYFLWTILSVCILFGKGDVIYVRMKSLPCIHIL